MNTIEQQIADVLPDVFDADKYQRTTYSHPVSDSSGVDDPKIIGIPEGQRDNTLASMAGSMRRKGFPVEAIAAALHVVNGQLCHPSLPDRDIERIARSMGRYAPENTAVAEDSGPIAERLPAFMARLQNRERTPDVIPELVPGQGITMFHGQPRALKTWTLDEIAIAASTGTRAFGLDRFTVAKPISVWIITEEDPELDVRDRIGCLLAGRGITTAPETLHLSVHRSVSLDDPERLAQMVSYARTNEIKLTIIDPIRASSAAVDQGPREIRPLAGSLRFYMRETGSPVVLGHHDTKPIAGKPDDRAKPQRASGGGIFSIADSPVHAELIGPGSRTILTPSHYKFSTAPDPFVIVLEADDPKRPTWVRIQGETTTAAVASEVALHEKILTYLREHPGTSGSRLAKGIHVSKADALNALDALRKGGMADYFKRGQAQLWSVLSQGSEA